MKARLVGKSGFRPLDGSDLIVTAKARQEGLEPGRVYELEIAQSGPRRTIKAIRPISESEARQDYGAMLEGYHLDPKVERAIALGINAGLPLLLYGPPGTGKTTAPVAYARQAGLSVTVIDLGAVVEKDDLFGSYGAVDGRTYYRQSPLVKAIQEPGLIVLDEIRRLPPFALNGFLGLLDKRRALMLPNGEIVKAHEQARFVATANDDNEGQFNLPEALDDRFKLRYHLGWPNPEAEKDILTAWGYTANQMMFLTELSANLRKQWDNTQIPFAPSLRTLDAIKKLLDTGADIWEAIDLTIRPRLLDPENGEAHVLDEAITAFKPYLEKL